MACARRGKAVWGVQPGREDMETRRQGVKEIVSPRRVACTSSSPSSDPIYLSFRLLPSGRYADIRQAEKPFDTRPFAQVMDLHGVTHELQAVAEDRRGEAPVAAEEEQQCDSEHGHGDAHQADRA